MATRPFEIIAGPANVWLAPVGTAFPAVNAQPASPWVYLGRTQGGVSVAHEQSIEYVTLDQDTAPLKAFRSEENLRISFSLAEVTLERYAKVLNDVSVTQVAGPPSIRHMQLYRGADVAEFAMLVRGPSPYGNFNLQYEVRRVVQSGEPEPSFTRDDILVLETEWTALVDPTATNPSEKFGRLVAQDA